MPGGLLTILRQFDILHSTQSIRSPHRPTNVSLNMTDTHDYTPPQVWVWEKDDSPKWRYGHTNRPIAGATHEKELARGKHPLQLYSLGRRQDYDYAGGIAGRRSERSGI